MLLQVGGAVPTTELAPGASMTVRVYLTPSRLGKISTTLTFLFGSGRKFVKASVPIIANVTR